MKDFLAVGLGFSDRVSKLPLKLQVIFFEDLETAIESRLAVLERSVAI